MCPSITYPVTAPCHHLLCRYRDILAQPKSIRCLWHLGGFTQVTRTGTQAHACREHQAGSPPAAQQYECRVPMGFSGLGRGCSQARTHKPSPKTSRCGWHSTEGQTGPCSRLTHGGAASLPWPHTTPGREAQPHEVPPPLPQPSCQLPSAAGPRCRQPLRWGKGTWGKERSQ